jgi:catalase
MELPDAAPMARDRVEMDESPALSIQKNQKDTLEGRKVGVLYDENSAKKDVEAVCKAITDAGGDAFKVAPKVGLNPPADGQLAGSPSVIFDAVALVLTAEDAAKLCNEAAAVQFVMDAFGHLKAIGASEGAKALLGKAGVEPDEGVTGLGRDFVKAAAKRFYGRESKVRMLA